MSVAEVMSASAAPAKIGPRLLRADDIAAELQVSARTVRGLIASGKIRSIRIGRCRRVAREELARLLAEGTG